LQSKMRGAFASSPAVRNRAGCDEAGGLIDVANEAGSRPIATLTGIGSDAMRKSGSPECFGGACEQQPHVPKSKQALVTERA